MKTLLLLRHAQPVQSEPSSFFHDPLITLDDHGRDRAAAVVPLLKELKPERCFCSPLPRCIESAQMLSSLGMTIDIQHDLREIDFGEWTGLTFDEIQKSDPAAVDRWADFDPEFSFPGGESIQHFLNRIGRLGGFFSEIPGGTVLAVTHAGVIRMLICHYLGLHPRHYVLFEVRYASVTTLTLFGDKGVLSGLNHEGVIRHG